MNDRDIILAALQEAEAILLAEAAKERIDPHKPSADPEREADYKAAIEALNRMLDRNREAQRIARSDLKDDQ